MSQSHNFLTIPEQRNDDEDEDAEGDARLLPRSSPVPRKRGRSIADETAEYLRIRLSLPRRRVSFADSAGEDLVAVREFVQFDSDEEECAGRHDADRPPAYRLCPEFEAPSGAELLRVVRAGGVAVERVSPVPDEPLAFGGLIRVLDVSYDKAVYVRATMDGWGSHFDHPAEYVAGSHDGDTDRFSFRLSFAPPYLFDGARIDFVVRYETPAGDRWANNDGKNYAVTLRLEPAGRSGRAAEPEPELRSILKPPRSRTEEDYDDNHADDKGDVAAGEPVVPAETPRLVQPLIVHPEIDIESEVERPSSPPMSRAHAAPEPERLSSRAAAELPLHKPIAIMPQDSQRLVQASQTLLPSELGCILLIQEVKDSSVCVASSTSGNVDAKTALDTIFEPILSHERATCDPDPVVATEVPSQPTLTSSSFPPSTLDVAREEKTFLEDVRKEQGMDPKETQKMTDESQMQVTKSTLAVRSDNQLLGFGAETSMSDVLDAKEKYDVRGVEDHSLKAGLETNSEDKTEVLLTTEKIHVPWLMPIQDTIPLGSAVESRTAQNLPILGPTFEIPVLQRCFNPNLVSESHKLNEHLPEGASASSNCPDVDRAESSFSEDKTREQWMDPNEPQEMTQETENTTTVRYDNTFLGFNVGSSLSDVLDETQKLDVSGVKDPCLTAGQEIDSENQTDGQTIRLVPTLVTISVGSTTEARMTQNLTVLGPSFETPVLQTHFSQDLLSGDMQNVTSLIKALSENNDVDEDFDVEQGSCHEVSKLGYELPANSEGSKEQTPCNLSRGPEIPGSQSEAIERRPLIPTFAFTLITVCLVVGFQEPNALLLIGLFLFSLYF